VLNFRSKGKSGKKEKKKMLQNIGRKSKIELKIAGNLNNDLNKKTPNCFGVSQPRLY